MMKNLSININEYIEGYYGRLLNLSERNVILKKLKSCNFNTYFYCPKEDLKHRLNWREDYTNNWIREFKYFCKNALKLRINVLVGISPGLDFNFKDNVNDFQKLVKKAKILKEKGASNIALMFDDIPPRFKNLKNEAVIHAELANDLSKVLNEKIFVVPRVYSDELIDIEYSYLDDFNKTLDTNIPIFYCGKKIISETNKNIELETIQKTTTNKVIFWDNLYANDYCPKRIFLGPYFGRIGFENTMINPTGLINTDLFILDLINIYNYDKNLERSWKKVLKKYKVPVQFFTISRYLFPINFRQENCEKIYDLNEEIEALDFLLWKWKNPLAREWYQYLLILKHNLQLVNGNLERDRIEKIFPIPLKDTLLKLKLEDK